MQDGHASSSFESDSVSDDGDSDPTRSSHTSSSDESEPEEITQEYVHSLLEKVRQDACAEDRREKMLKEDVPYEQDVTKVDAEEEEPPLPSLDPGKLPLAYFEFGDTRHEAPSTVRDPSVSRAEVATSAVAVPAPPPEPKPTGLTKRQIKAVCKAVETGDMVLGKAVYLECH